MRSAMPELRRKCTQPRPAHNALRNPRVVHLSALLWRWVDTKTLTRCALVTPIPATSQTQATESGVLGHSPLFRQPNPPPRPHNILSQRPRQPSFFIFSTEACIAHEPGASSGIAWKRREEINQGKSSPASRGGGSLNPLSTRSVQGPQALTSGTHRANCVQSMAPDPVEPSRTQSQPSSHGSGWLPFILPNKGA